MLEEGGRIPPGAKGAANGGTGLQGQSHMDLKVQRKDLCAWTNNFPSTIYLDKTEISDSSLLCWSDTTPKEPFQTCCPSFRIRAVCWVCLPPMHIKVKVTSHLELFLPLGKILPPIKMCSQNILIFELSFVWGRESPGNSRKVWEHKTIKN